MWNDLVIGESKGHTTAQVINGIERISKNKDEYWISDSDSFLGIGMTICKGTLTGKMLTRLINEKDLAGIAAFVKKVVCEKCSPTQLVEAIEKTNHEAFKKGKKEARSIMQAALGLR